MASSFVQVAADDVGKKLQTWVIDTDKHLEIMVLGGDGVAALAHVLNVDPAVTAYALPTRPIPFGAVSSFVKTYTTAVADDILVNPGAVTAYVTMCTITAAKKNSKDVDILVGLDATDVSAGNSPIASHPGLPPGEIYVVGNGQGVIAKGAASDDILVDITDTGVGAVDVLVTYFTV